MTQAAVRRPGTRVGGSGSARLARRRIDVPPNYYTSALLRQLGALDERDLRYGKLPALLEAHP